MASAKIHITKIAAAERQLRSAIRLYFAEEDDLAIHTVASAAYQLLKDIKSKRGMNEAEDVTLTSIFYVVRSYRRGTLPQELTSDPEFMEYIRHLAEMLPIDKETKIENFSLSLPPEEVGEFWRRQNKISNFLKHADRDSRASIPLEEVNNLLLIMQCLSAYIDITKDELGNEGFVFQLYVGVIKTCQTDHAQLHNEMVSKFSGVPEDEKLNFCSTFITELNKILK